MVEGGALTATRYGMSIIYRIRAEDKRYAKRMMRDGRLKIVDVGPIEYGLSFDDLLDAKVERLKQEMLRAVEEALFVSFG